MDTNWSSTRLYGATIALVSGFYSIAMSLDMTSTTDSVMALVGVIVVLHGVALLTPLVSRIGRAGGPLMLLYSIVMLGNQALMSTNSSTMGTGMNTGMNSMNSGMSTTGGMGFDAGMVAIALIMLASGLIMTYESSVGQTSDQSMPDGPSM
ncbi:hypothetical protein KU306_17055 (plasmid) [Haloferax larsenii]|uniref:Uncharacterized protein n=2 Tax=Haloferax larsenii TaxID=302484 RepID=A0ABY5RKS7_HALLR|nr:hypothetical protein KU306_17055 [Haloferax larsenii]